MFVVAHQNLPGRNNCYSSNLHRRLWRLRPRSSKNLQFSEMPSVDLLIHIDVLTGSRGVAFRKSYGTRDRISVSITWLSYRTVANIFILLLIHCTTHAIDTRVGSRGRDASPPTASATVSVSGRLFAYIQNVYVRN